MTRERQNRLEQACKDSRILLESFKLASETGEQWNDAEHTNPQTTDFMCVAWAGVAAVLQLSHQVASLRVDLLEGGEASERMQAHGVDINDASGGTGGSE